MTRKNPSLEILCRLHIIKNCYLQHVAEVVDSFWIVSPIYSSYQDRISVRYELHQNFQDYVQSIGMTPCTLEALRMDRNQKYLMTRPGREPYEIQTQFYDDVYIRENLLNVAARKIKDWEYMGWIDAHHMFENVYWWQDAIIDMERYASVQLFQTLTWHGWSNETWWTRPGAIYATKIKRNVTFGDIPYFGNAYSVRKEIYDQMDYILDTCIGGCCDCSYVKASIDSNTIFDYMDQWPEYSKQLKPWIEKTSKVFKGRRNGVRGNIIHLPHETNFLYFSMMDTLDQGGYDVNRDVKRDENFTLYLVNDSFKKKFEFYGYFANYKNRIITGIVTVSVLLGGCVLFCILKCIERRNKSRYTNF